MKIKIPPVNITLYSDPSLERSIKFGTRIAAQSVYDLIRKTVENTRSALGKRQPSIELFEEIAELLLQIYPKLIDNYTPSPDPPHVKTFPILFIIRD